MKVALLLAGPRDDGGFMEAGHRGAREAVEAHGVELMIKDRVEPEPSQLEAGLEELVAGGASLIIAHGGQNTSAVNSIAAKHPDVDFVVTQSDAVAENVGSYEVLQEESAFLAGAAAGMLSKTGTVGHMSGIRPVPGLKGRAAYVAGVKHERPDATVLTNFSGDQDDQQLAQRVAGAELEAGADVIFTMLNQGRPGVGRAIEEHGSGRQIGNVIDFVAQDPKMFVGSAVADSSVAVRRAIDDAVAGRETSGKHRTIGLEEEAAVRLTLAPDVPQDVRDRVAELSRQIVDGDLEVPTDYDGPEFPNP